MQRSTRGIASRVRLRTRLHGPGAHTSYSHGEIVTHRRYGPRRRTGGQVRTAQQRRAASTRKQGARMPTAIDLFCGAGGLSTGLSAAGFNVALGLDFDRHAVETYRTNHAAPCLLMDIRDVSGSDLMGAA